MNYLLDTHTFLWWADQYTLLSSTAYQLCQDTENTLFLSIASVWEIQIKVQIGKLALPMPLKDMVDIHIKNNKIEFLPIQLPHIYHLATLPNHHKDPFDRLLISQAMIENLPMITSDADIAKYPVQTVW
jgi:PIN domain nuclease of toxin-antitoxin system